MRHLLHLLGSILVTSPAFALDINPGLWEIKSEVIMAGKSFDPMAAMETAMALLPEDQKKALQEKMAESKSHVEFGKNKNVRICQSEKTLKDTRTIEESSDCKLNLKTNTPQAMNGDFVCKEQNFKGTFDLKVKDKNNYEYRMTGNGPKNIPMELKYKAKFISKNCGKVKPLE